MMNYLKEKNFQFKLIDENVEEEFTIWKAWEKRMDTYLNQDGVEMSFPIKQGVLADNEGKIEDIQKLKYMNREEWNKRYGKYMKSSRYTRRILVNEQEYSYSFTMSANNQLITLCDSIKMLGKPVTEVIFAQSFDKGKSPAKMYTMTIIGPSTPTETQPTETKTIEGIPVQKAPEGPFIMSSIEQDIVGAIKAVEGTLDNIAIIEIMKKNSIPEIRANIIFENVFKK